MRFDRQKFFQEYRKQFGSLTQQQVNGLERLLKCIENDQYVTIIPQAAYMLGNVKHETAHTFQPIHEYGGKAYFIKRYGGQTRKGRELGNDTPEEGYDYAGKGDTQATGESNYEKLEAGLRREYPEVVADFERRTGRMFDLTVGDQPNDKADPQNMLDPAISYVSMSFGMRTGLYTGHKLSTYVNRSKKDYRNARKVINGLDKAATIAGYAVKFEQILKASATDTNEGERGATTASAASHKTTATDGPSLNPSGDPLPDGSEQAVEPPPVVKPQDEVTKTEKTTSGTGETATTTVVTKNEQDVNQTATVTTTQYQGVGFIGALKKDFAVVGGGNLSFQSLQEYAVQASGWPEWVVSIITKVALIAAILGIAWLIFRLGHYVIWKIGDKSRMKIEADINSDPKRKNIEFT